jgi:hypothetical protein
MLHDKQLICDPPYALIWLLGARVLAGYKPATRFCSLSFSLPSISMVATSYNPLTSDYYTFSKDAMVATMVCMEMSPSVRDQICGLDQVSHSHWEIEGIRLKS